MTLSLTAALQSLRGMAVNFLQQLPYFLIALLVYGVFHIVARLTRRTIRRLTERRKRHRNLGLVLGRLAEGGLLLTGVLVGFALTLLKGRSSLPR